jgi:hypothetical protein
MEARNHGEGQIYERKVVSMLTKEAYGDYYSYFWFGSHRYSSDAPAAAQADRRKHQWK